MSRHVWLALGAMPAVVLAQPGPEAGQALFTEHCAICHGAAGEGGAGPDLTSPRWLAGVSDAELERIIRDGKPATAMPAFAATIDVRGREAIVAHLRRLGRQAVQPANDLPGPAVDVPPERLLRAEEGAANWLMYGRDYGNQRFSPLRRIHRNNIRNLAPVWSFQTGVPDGLEATPLVVDGVIFLSTSWNHVFAIDTRTGAELWHYRRRLPPKLRYCCGPVNRGVAVWRRRLFLATLDAHLVALDVSTGRPLWDIEIGKVGDNLSATSPPMVVGDKVIVGIAGGDYPSRGFIDAYDAASGRRLWRFYTVPAPGEPGSESWTADSWERGGGATWMWGSYDPALDLIFWGTGNPYPDFDGEARRGDNLFTDCVLALEADTGTLRWHYQFTPGDVWDYDGVNEMVFAELRHGGRTVKALLHADRNGHLYAIERATGKLLYARPFVRVSWARGFDENGRPIVDPSKIPTPEGVEVCPGAAGGKEWNAGAYSPLTRLLYLPVIENCALFFNSGVEARRRGLPPGPSGFRYLPNQAYGKVMAVRADTGEPAWEVRTRTPMGAGMLATAGGLLFTGDAEGNFLAYDAVTGRQLWSYQTGSGIRGGPVTFLVDGKQYVAIASGMAGAVGGYTGAGAPWMRNYRTGDTLFVFALFEPGASSRFHGGARR